MAAVFALVFLPAVAAVGFMLRASPHVDLGTVLALGCFIPMVAGVFYGTLRVVAKAEA